MPLNQLEIKKIYYYVICVLAFFVLMWGIVDLASSSAGILIVNRAAAYSAPALAPAPEGDLPAEANGQFFDYYYQRKMLYDRFWDSLARIFVSGIIFAYFRSTANRLEKAGAA